MEECINNPNLPKKMEEYQKKFGTLSVEEMKKFVGQAKREEKLIRSGDILNPLGVLRSAFIYDHILTKEQFVALVKRNYNIIDKDLSEKMLEKVNFSWKQAIKFFKDFDLLINSSAQKIEIKEPLECF